MIDKLFLRQVHLGGQLPLKSCIEGGDGPSKECLFPSKTATREPKPRGGFGTLVLEPNPASAGTQMQSLNYIRLRKTWRLARLF